MNQISSSQNRFTFNRTFTPADLSGRVFLKRHFARMVQPFSNGECWKGHNISTESIIPANGPENGYHYKYVDNAYTWKNFLHECRYIQIQFPQQKN